MDGFLKSTELIAFKKETTPGDFETSLKTDPVNLRMREANWGDTPEKDDEASRYQNGEAFSSDESITTKTPATVDGMLKLAPPEFIDETSPGAGDAIHRNNYTTIMNGCALLITGIGTDVTDATPGQWLMYPDKSQTMATVSAIQSLYSPKLDKQQLSEAAGMMGNFSIMSEGTGQPLKFTFNFSGKMVTVEQVDGGNGPQFDDTTVMKTVSDSLRNTSIILKEDGTGPDIPICLSTFTLESGNDVQPVDCQQGNSGIIHNMVMSFNPNLAIDPLLRSLDDLDWWKAVSKSEKSYSFDFQSEFFNIFIPRVQVNSSPKANSNGVIRTQYGMRPLLNVNGIMPPWYAGLGVPEPSNKGAVPYYLLMKETLKQI